MLIISYEQLEILLPRHRCGNQPLVVLTACCAPVNFEAATAFITEDDMREVFGIGPDASAHLAVAQQFVDAGYDHLALINAGPDPEGFFDFFASELAEPLRKLTPSS